jgi:hypothetical protein
LHAKNDHPEVRAKFFELLRQLPDFAIHIVIGRKKLEVFNRKHNNSPTEFYFDLLHHLLKDCLQEPDQTYVIYPAQRGKNNSDRFQAAVDKALPQTGQAAKKRYRKPGPTNGVSEPLVGPGLSLYLTVDWQFQAERL